MRLSKTTSGLRRGLLTVNLSLRYQFFEPYHAVYSRTQHIRPASRAVNQAAPLGMSVRATKGFAGLVPADKNNFAPRVGLAWDPLGNGRLSIRAAYGLFYEDMRSDIWTYPAVNQPFVISDTVPAPFSFNNPFRGTVIRFLTSTLRPRRIQLSQCRCSRCGQLSIYFVHDLDFTVEKALPETWW